MNSTTQTHPEQPTHLWLQQFDPATREQIVKAFDAASAIGPQTPDALLVFVKQRAKLTLQHSYSRTDDVRAARAVSEAISRDWHAAVGFAETLMGNPAAGEQLVLGFEEAAR